MDSIETYEGESNKQPPMVGVYDMDTPIGRTNEGLFLWGNPDGTITPFNTYNSSL